jgi:hypothetical protein
MCVALTWGLAKFVCEPGVLPSVGRCKLEVLPVRWCAASKSRFSASWPLYTSPACNVATVSLFTFWSSSSVGGGWPEDVVGRRKGSYRPMEPPGVSGWER